MQVHDEVCIYAYVNRTQNVKKTSNVGIFLEDFVCVMRPDGSLNKEFELSLKTLSTGITSFRSSLKLQLTISRMLWKL